jgi:hypothetical protein
VEVFVTGEDAVAPVPSEGFKGTLILIDRVLAGDEDLHRRPAGDEFEVVAPGLGDGAAVGALGGTLILIVDGKPARVALAPAGANRLAGTAAAALPAKPCCCCCASAGAVAARHPANRAARLVRAIS